MSARYFVDTDGHDLHLWRQDGDSDPTIVTNPVDAWHKGREQARREIEAERPDVHALAEAFVQRMTWPSMHWRTQSLDYDAAHALAELALKQAPNLIAVARAKAAAIAEAVAR